MSSAHLSPLENLRNLYICGNEFFIPGLVHLRTDGFTSLLKEEFTLFESIREVKFEYHISGNLLDTVAQVTDLRNHLVTKRIIDLLDLK